MSVGNGNSRKTTLVGNKQSRTNQSRDSREPGEYTSEDVEATTERRPVSTSHLIIFSLSVCVCPDVCVCCDLMEQLATKRQRTTETNENQNEKEKADKRFLFLDSSFSVKPKRQSAVKETAGSFPNCPISAFSTPPHQTDDK